MRHGIVWSCVLIIWALARQAEAAPPPFARFLGTDSQRTRVNAVTSDRAGNLYVTGWVHEGHFPSGKEARGKASGVYVLKLSPDATQVLGTFIFGGSGADEGTDIAVDSTGHVWVVGDTESDDFPVTPRALQGKRAGSADAFLVRIDPSLSQLVASTYFGGDGHEFARALAVDSSGAVWITGSTGSRRLPTVNPLQAQLGESRGAYVARLSADADRVLFASYLGGSAESEGTAIATDANGNAVVVGTTASKDLLLGPCPVFRTLRGNRDAFVTGLGPDGRLRFATYLGATQDEHAVDVAIDPAGNTVVLGMTLSPDFPITPGATRAVAGNRQAFVASLDPTGARLRSAVTLGGSYDDSPIALSLDEHGAAYVLGQTQSYDLVTTLDAAQPKVEASYDLREFMLVKLTADHRSLAYATYLGGRGHEYPRDVLARPDGSAWLLGITESSNYPHTGMAATLTPGATSVSVLSRVSTGATRPAARVPRASSGSTGGCPTKPGRPLRVAMTGNYLPLHGQHAGASVGFEADLALVLGEALGREVVFLDRAALGKLSSLEAVKRAKADIALSAITPTPERRRLVDFSEPYLELQVRLAAPYGQPAASASVEGKRVALVDGPWWSEASAALRGAEVRKVASPEQALALLDTGEVDFVAGEDVGLVAASRGAGLTPVGAPLARSPVAAAVRKGTLKTVAPAFAATQQAQDVLRRHWKLTGDALFEVDARPPPPPTPRVYVALCTPFGAQPLAVVQRDGSLEQLLGLDTVTGRPLTAEEQQEVSRAQWFHVRGATVRSLPGDRCRGTDGFLVSRDGVVEAPPGEAPPEAGPYVRVDAEGRRFYLSAVPFEESKSFPSGGGMLLRGVRVKARGGVKGDLMLVKERIR